MFQSISNPPSISEHPLAKTHQSLHDVQHSIEQLNLAERDSHAIVDDLALNNQSPTPRQRKSSLTARSNTTTTINGAKKRLDYDIHNNKQSNASELFERLSQPKTRAKKEKPKPQQQQPSTSTGVWK